MTDREMGSRSRCARDPHAESMRWGIVGSVVLHGAALLFALAVGLAGLNEMPPSERIVPVELVRLGEKTASPASAHVARVPQEKAKEVAPSEAATAVPVPETPSPPAAPRQTAEQSPPPIIIAPRPSPKPPMPRPVIASRADALSAARQPRQTSPAEDLAARLESLARLRQPAAPIPPSPRLQDGSGVSNVTATSAHAAHGWDATYGVKDFIRAQVERRWNLDRSEAAGEDWTVSVHILLDQNGRVRQAEIVADPRLGTDSAYRNFALSARNAVLLSSPLLILPGAYDIAKDIVVDFNVQQVSR